MDPSQFPDEQLPGGIPSRISGLAAALLRHLLALAELATEETRLLVSQSLTAIILLASLILVVMISYLALVAAIVSLLTLGIGWNWPTALVTVSFFHLLLAAVILLFLRIRTSNPAFEATAAELRRDMESLASYSRQSSDSQ